MSSTEAFIVKTIILTAQMKTKAYRHALKDPSARAKVSAAMAKALSVAGVDERAYVVVR